MQLLEQYNRAVDSGLSQTLLNERYGRRPWFLIDPHRPPPYSKFHIAVKDKEGRGYNFPMNEPNTVHVRTPKSKPNRGVGDPHVEIPEPDETVQLLDGRSFVVLETIAYLHKRTNTAILHVRWN